MFRIIEKLKARSENMSEEPPVSFAVFGDSVTQGCFEVNEFPEIGIEPIFESKNCYGEKLKQIFSILYPNAPVTLINAGISGDSAPSGARRIRRDVLSYRPDLVIVSYGLNDCVKGREGISEYRQALREIMQACRAENTEMIFMTQNFMCQNTENRLTGTMKNIAGVLGRIQKDGVLRDYMSAAKDEAGRLGVPVCDCYTDWENLAVAGVNTDGLLSNALNHPSRDLHWLFAVRLAELLFHDIRSSI